MPDVFYYNQLPQQLRVQIIHIIRDSFGVDRYGSSHAEDGYKLVNGILCREYGIFNLTDVSRTNAESIFKFFLEIKDYEKALDVVEVEFRFIDKVVRELNYSANTDREIEPENAIKELNARFREHGVGYQYESGELIRVDSQFIHAEAVKPTLALLRDKIYNGENEEFLKAHEHYRHNRFKECLNETLKYFESTMKSICVKHKWPFQQSDTAKTLIDVCLRNGLIPMYLQS